MGTGQPGKRNISSGLEIKIQCGNPAWFVGRQVGSLEGFVEPSQSHGMVWLGKELKIIPFHPCPGQGHLPLSQLAPIPVQPGFGYFQGWVILGSVFKQKKMDVLLQSSHLNPGAALLCTAAFCSCTFPGKAGGV